MEGAGSRGPCLRCVCCVLRASRESSRSESKTSGKTLCPCSALAAQRHNKRRTTHLGSPCQACHLGSWESCLAWEGQAGRHPRPCPPHSLLGLWWPGGRRAGRGWCNRIAMPEGGTRTPRHTCCARLPAAVAHHQARGRATHAHARKAWNGPAGCCVHTDPAASDCTAAAYKPSHDHWPTSPTTRTHASGPALGGLARWWFRATTTTTVHERATSTRAPSKASPSLPRPHGPGPRDKRTRRVPKPVPGVVPVVPGGARRQSTPFAPTSTGR